jgi:hypothetical protein
MCLNRFAIVALVGMAGLLSSCSGDFIEAGVADRGNLNAGTYIAIGSTETSGFTDGALYKAGQEYSYPALIALQIEATGTVNFKQPVVTGNDGIAFYNGAAVPRLILAHHIFYCSGDSMLIPERKNVPADSIGFFVNNQGPFNNLAVPGLKASDLTNSNLATENIYYARIKGDSVNTLIQDIQARNASFFTVWLGTQEVLDYAMAGGEGNPVNLGAFRAGLSAVLDSLMADSATTGVIANIPDVTEFPYFNTITYNFLTLTPPLANVLNNAYAGRFTFAEGPNAFVLADASAQDDLRQATPQDKIVLGVPVDSLRCQFIGSFTPMPGRYYLNAQEVETAKQYVRDLNAIIEEEAAERNIPVADLNGLYASLDAGILYNGVEFTNVLVNGNFFSLDGLNPNVQGNAFIANKFLELINKEYKASIPLLDPTSFTGTLFP